MARTCRIGRGFLLFFVAAWTVMAVAAAGETCTTDRPGSFGKECALSDDVNKTILKNAKDKNAEDREKAEKEADDFIESQTATHKDKQHSKFLSKDTDLDSSTIAKHVFNSRKQEYSGLKTRYEAYLKDRKITSTADKTNKANIDAFLKTLSASGQGDVTSVKRLQTDPKYGFVSLYQADKKGYQNAENLLEEEAIGETKEILKDDRESLVEMYRNKKEELDEKYDGKSGKKSRYENLEFSSKVMKKDMVPFYVELGGESPNDVIAVLKQSDPTLVGCHALTLPSDKLKIVGGSGANDQSGTAATAPLKTEEVPCNLMSYFADDASQGKIQQGVDQCMDDAIAKAKGKKIKSIRTFVDSCASMVRSKNFGSNLDLSKSRALAMESAVNSYVNGKGYSGVADTPEVNYKGENKDAAGEHNGTCGPLPPVGFGVEPGLIAPSCDKNGTNLSEIEKREKEMAALRKDLGVKCAGETADKAGYDWLCDKSFPKSAADGKDRKKYEEAYGKHRKAEIRVVVEYEDEPQKTPPSKTPEKTPPSSLAQKPKSVIQCYKPSLSYDTFSRKTTKGTSITIGGAHGGRGGFGKGKKKVAECPVFESESGRNSAGEEITLFKFKYWSRQAHREGVRAEDTEMGGNYGESDQ